MSILKNLSMRQRLGLALVLGACLYALLYALPSHAETLTMLPCHGPGYRAPAEAPNPGWFGLIVTIGAIIFLWSEWVIG